MFIAIVCALPGLALLAACLTLQRQRDALASARRLNTGLTRRVEELETANQALEAFSYSVSHDLRRPLRVIDGFSTALLQRHFEQLDPDARRSLMLVHDTARQMDRLIEDLLRLARLPRSGLNRKTLDVAALAREIADGLMRREPGSQVMVSIATPLFATADAGLLRVVLDNLLGNAWKFSARREQPCIEVGALEQAGERVFFVRDNGAGFDMRHARKLFLPFQRLHRDEDYSGTGIGLATAHRIIQRHGGRIWADSALGRGATFYFTLPELDNRK